MDLEYQANFRWEQIFESVDLDEDPGRRRDHPSRHSDLRQVHPSGDAPGLEMGADPPLYLGAFGMAVGNHRRTSSRDDLVKTVPKEGG